MKNLIFCFCLLLSLNGLAQSLPMTVTQTEFNNGNIFTEKNKMSWGGGTIDSGDGTGTFVMHITDAPHILKFEYSRNKYGTNHSMKVEESADNKSWTTLTDKAPSTSWQSYNSTLKSTTRYLRFSYWAEYKFGDVGTKHCYWKDIVITKRPLIASTFTLPQLQTPINTESEMKTFTITKTALTNDVTVTCDNPAFAVTPNTLDKSNGTATIEVTFKPTEKGLYNGTITVQENGTDLKEVIAISGLSTTAELSASPLADFSTVEGKAVTQETNVSTKDLEGVVSLSISGSGASHFSLSRNEMTENGIIVVTYLPLASGKHEATLTLSTPYATDVVLPLVGNASRSPFNSIFKPLIIGQSEFNNGDIVMSKSSVSWNGGEIKSGDGAGSFVVAIEGVPHTLTLDCSRNEWGKDNNMKIEESSDNSNWTEVSSINPPTDWASYSHSLKAATRYLRFTYHAEYKAPDIWTKNGYWRNIKVTKNNVQSTTLVVPPFTNEMGTTATNNFEIGAANLVGSLQVVSSNNLFTVSPTLIDKADAERIYGFPIEVTYSPTETGRFEGVIDITDNENPNNTLSIQVSGITKPATPEALPASEILPTALQINWNAVEGVRGYLLTVKQEGVEAPLLDKTEVGNVTSYLLNELQAGTQYSYQVWSVGAGELISDEGSNIIDARTLVRPTITTSTPAEFLTTEGVALKQEITVNAEELLDKITIKVVGTNAALFTVDKSEMSAAGTIEVTYLPTVSGVHTAVLQIETLYIESLVNISLSGSAKPAAPVVLTASNITPVGFTAQWKAQAGASGYKLWVKDASGTPVAEYNGKELGSDLTSHAVKGLQPSTTYTYELTALNGVLTSDASSAIEVTTGEAPIITHSPVGEFNSTPQEKVSQHINIGGERLSRYIEVSISGEAFSVDKNEIQPTGESLQISFEPQTTGIFNGEIRLNTPFAEEVIIPLTGSAISTSIVNTCPNNSCSQYIVIENQQLYYTFDNETSVRVINTTGGVVKLFNGTTGVESLHELAKGVYHILFAHNGESFVLKVIL